MKDSTIKIMEDGSHGLARFYDMGTNLKLNYVFTDKRNSEDYLIVELREPLPLREEHIWIQIDVKGIEREYTRLNSLTPEEAVAEYKDLKSQKPPVPKTDPKRVDELLNSLDRRGAWVEEISVHDPENSMNIDKSKRRKTIRGISTRSFVSNMNVLMNYIRGIRETGK